MITTKHIFRKKPYYGLFRVLQDICTSGAGFLLKNTLITSGDEVKEVSVLNLYNGGRIQGSEGFRPKAGSNIFLLVKNAYFTFCGRDGRIFSYSLFIFISLIIIRIIKSFPFPPCDLGKGL